MLERFATVGIQWKLSWGEIRDEEFRDTHYMWLSEPKSAWIHERWNWEIIFSKYVEKKLTEISELIDLRDEKGRW